MKGRPIAVIGPSGTGKSLVAQRIVGHKPTFAPDASVGVERHRWITRWQGQNVLVAPGSFIQDKSGGIHKVIDSLCGDSPPLVVCNVVASGFHATATEALRGTFLRPDSKGVAIADNLEGFLKACLQEETSYLQQIMDLCKQNKIKHRIPAIITIINKRDLWEATYARDSVLERYMSKDTDYGSAINQLKEKWGLPATPSNHIVFPMYTFAGGFHPEQTAQSLALTAEAAEADAMVLRALIFFQYTEGRGFP